MKHTVKIDNIAIRDLNELLVRITPDTAFFKITPVEGKRSKFVSIADIKADPEDIAIIESRQSIIVPADSKKNIIEWASVAPSPAVKVDPGAKVSPKQPKAKKEAKKAKTPQPQSTGFMKRVRELNAEGSGQLSKHSSRDAVNILMKEFPGKSAKSVHRICYNVARLTGRRWKRLLVNTGYMNRIDELLKESQLTTRLIGEMVSVEFGKDPTSCKNVVRARLTVMRGMGMKLNVPQETEETRNLTYLDQ